MSTLLAAARLGDPVAHTASKGWMMAGLIAGALIGAAAVVVTGGAALTLVAAAAAGAAAGGGLGEVLGTMSWAPRHVTGSLISGSFNVFVNGRPAVHAHLSQGICGDHSGSPQLVAQGSSTVFINGQPAARMEDMLTCSAVISAGSPNVFIGGATVTTDDISPEIPGWVNWTMLAVGVAAAAVLAGPLVAALGTVGGIAGGETGTWLGGKFFGDGSDGQKWSMLGGGLLGGLAGVKGANAALKVTGKTSGVPSSTTQTGARQVLDPNTVKGWDAAEGAYDAIRGDATDVSAIAKNTGMSEARIARIKEHVFIKEHALDSGVRRFDADPDIVNSWNRLKTGDWVESDLDLLQHERFESKFEAIFKTDYRTAHDAAIRSGRTWTPE